MVLCVMSTEEMGGWCECVCTDEAGGGSSLAWTMRKMEELRALRSTVKSTEKSRQTCGPPLFDIIVSKSKKLKRRNP